MERMPRYGFRFIPETLGTIGRFPQGEGHDWGCILERPLWLQQESLEEDQ